MARRQSAVAATPQANAYPKTRRIRFRFGEEGRAGKYFIEDDIVYSHFVAGLSGGFPPGEEGFIRSVRKFSDRITDPELKKRVAGFIGQESVHGQEHRRVNEKLVELGYPIAWWDSAKQVRRLVRFENRLPPRAHLAMTAMAEHMTAILAERMLGSEEVQAIPGDPEVWHLLNWHALEELEHKSVAFDVYRAVGGTEATRIGLMMLAMAVVPPLTLTILAGSLLSDPVARRQPLRLIKEARGLFRGPLFRGLAGDVRKYLRPGFHPDDIDTDALLQRWQTELFGSDGVLVDHLK
ncbi:metal-dependent hydrolase [Mycobacterium sp. CBMA271]|uniref:metal-dependent hydrolase n=1 Tax=unclassified Mycobacteroides TaxID=2618759 RepID=UPI0012DEF7BC|nr:MULTISPECIES: metal-dependent hydrolase [unclassified Mycobacteroides]MUM19789.1 metal-dependent hydrolase [Mycobacteroides sp. CBMA 326]MUM21054.1 metal-dependent hydrolase [Mycobacteroides sp. CBMA 271]